MTARLSFVVAATAVATFTVVTAASQTRPAPAQPPVQAHAPAPVVAGPAEPGSAPASAEPGVYRIGPEDLLVISVWKNPELTRSVSVRPDGRISLPLLNDVQAANLTPMQLRDAIAKGLTSYFDPGPEVSVIVQEIHSVKVSVVGAVKNPNRYELKSQATVLEALAMAGGLTDFAKRDRIVIYRRDGASWKTIEFSYSKVVNDWDVKENFVLMPGDIVVVP